MLLIDDLMVDLCPFAPKCCTSSFHCISQRMVVYTLNDPYRAISKCPRSIYVCRYAIAMQAVWFHLVRIDVKHTTLL